MDSVIGFHCNACGKCCNTPPAMSVRELFLHRDRFIGTQAVGQVRRLPAGSQVAEGAGKRVLVEEDAKEVSALQNAIFHQSRAGARSGYVLSLVTQAFEYPSRGRCPALADDGNCIIHRQDKPLMCRVVPLDPYLPDRLQDSVLLNRRTAAAFMGASCIKPGAELPYRPLVQHRRVAETAFEHDLRRRRAELEQEKKRWGRAVAGMLENELDQGSPPQRFGGDAYLVLPLAPVLAVLAAEGESMREQCVQYIDAQLALIGEAVSSALARKRPEDKPATVQLRSFAHAYARQRTLLASRVQVA